MNFFSNSDCQCGRPESFHTEDEVVSNEKWTKQIHTKEEFSMTGKLRFTGYPSAIIGNFVPVNLFGLLY